jgi:glyoxylase-like metal-dependent hydrolase (beta-lactamase superfamily II)
MSHVERIQCGNGNCYLICENDHAVLVDTARARFRYKILDACQNKNVRLIVLTHGHIDHVQNAAFLAEELNVPIAMHQSDYALSKDNLLEPLSAHTLLGKIVLALSGKAFKNDEIPSFMPKAYLKEGDTLSEYGVSAKIVELPGHTKGSIGLLIEDSIIVGDALMNFVRPSLSLLYGDLEMVKKSADKLKPLSGMIYFGHGKPVKNAAGIF